MDKPLTLPVTESIVAMAGTELRHTPPVVAIEKVSVKPVHKTEGPEMAERIGVVSPVNVRNAVSVPQLAELTM